MELISEEADETGFRCPLKVMVFSPLGAGCSWTSFKKVKKFACTLLCK